MDLMNEKFLAYNRQLEDPERFRELDHHLSKLKQYSYTPALLSQLPIDTPGIYTLTGGGLVGKTTLLKLWIEKLLTAGMPAQTIHYYSEEFIDNYHLLISMLRDQLTNKSPDVIQYVLLDNITRDSGWEKAIKYLSEHNLLDHVVLMIASADSATILKIKSFNTTNFHLYPLSFSEFVSMKQKSAEIINLHVAFNHYLLHGGYHSAIRDFTLHGKILDETFTSYSTWLITEIRQQEKQESFLREILEVIITHENQPVTWNALTRKLLIQHPKTIGDYVAQLESLDAITVQYALSEETLSKAPKRARKLMFFDPFIFHSIRAYLQPGTDLFENQVAPMIANPANCAALVEACVISLYNRYYPTYYIQAEGYINLAYLYNDRFRPVLITWENQLHAKDLKQILKYPSGKILTKSMKSGMIEHIRTEPLPQALLKLHD